MNKHSTTPISRRRLPGMAAAVPPRQRKAAEPMSVAARLRLTLGTLLAALALAVGTAAAAPAASAAPAPAPVDWSRAVVDSTMRAHPDPTTLGGWGYQPGLFLYGVDLVYRRTHDPRYLAYLKTWVDHFVSASGHIDNAFDSLDSMQSGNLLILLDQQTGEARYATAAAQIRARLDTYPRTPDGGFWHATTKTNQLWLDGTYMVLPFLLRSSPRRWPTATCPPPTRPSRSGATTAYWPRSRSTPAARRPSRTSASAPAPAT
jgi:hypothetical protein